MVLALIPAYNEAETIADVVAGVSAHCPDVVVVDDGSTDDTAALAEGGGARVIRLSPNRGKGAALRSGLDHALDIGSQAVITLDGDGQHDPSEIPRFLGAWQADVGDLIVGARDYGRMPWTRRTANATGRRLLRWATGADFLDNQSGYRLLNSRALRQLRPTRDDFAAEVQMIVDAHHNGLRIGWVPISTIYEEESSHFHPVQDGSAFLRLIWIMRKSRGGPPVA